MIYTRINTHRPRAGASFDVPLVWAHSNQEQHVAWGCTIRSFTEEPWSDAVVSEYVSMGDFRGKLVFTEGREDIEA